MLVRGTILAAMDVELRDAHRTLLGRAHIDVRARPVLVRIKGQDSAEHEVFLQWDGAVDDAGQLRTCVACGCPHLYRQRSLPQFTPFVLVLAAAGFVLGVMGYSNDPIVLAALMVLLVLDIGALIFARTLLVCYRCRTRYGKAKVGRYIARWNARTAALPECQTEPTPQIPSPS
jgi:hypothetical protein